MTYEAEHADRICGIDLSGTSRPVVGELTDMKQVEWMSAAKR